MATMRRVRADPGGSVRLTFFAGGWTVARESGPSLDTEHWLLIGMLGFLFAGAATRPLDVVWLSLGLAAIGALFLLALLVFALVQFLGTVIGAAWLAGSAMSRKGRRKLRAEAGNLWSAVEAANRTQEYMVRADQVRTASVGTGFAGSTTVDLTMADGSTQRYTSWRFRRELAAAFR